MNKNRKREIGKVADSIKEELNKLQDLLNEEQNYYDNIPENLQGSMKGEESENAIELLEEAVDSLETCLEALLNT